MRLAMDACTKLATIERWCEVVCFGIEAIDVVVKT